MRRTVMAAGLALAFVGCGDPSQPSDSPAPTVRQTPSPPVPASSSPSPTEAEPSAAVSPSPSVAPEVAAWQRLDAEGPSAREDHTWTLDPSTGIAYLFGGRDGTRVRGDLWGFDLPSDTWLRLRPEGEGPAPRFGHEAVWVDGFGVVVWAGQAGPTDFFSDLWAYDPLANSWSRLPGDGARPVARYGSCSAVGLDGRLWISHGFTSEGARFSDTRAYDFAARRWTDQTPDGNQPVVRCLHACWLTADGRLALYAGQTTGVRALGDLWSLALDEDDARWATVDGDLPPARNLPAATRYGDDVVVFGGLGLDGDYLRDVYRIDGTTLAFEDLIPDGRRPRARAGAALVEDHDGHRILMFGGTGGEEALRDTWQLELP